MSLLILALPPTAAPGPLLWVTSADGQVSAQHGHAPPELLPHPGRGAERVAVVPASQLSWHQLELPPGLGPRSPRLRAALVGLLEDQLLDEPEQLHLALSPDADRHGGPVWVAACARPWLQAHLHALEAAGHPIDRIVPELHPHDGPLQWLATGTPEQAWLLASGQPLPGAPLALPLSAASLALLRSQLPSDPDQAPPALLAEPAVFSLAESLFGPWLDAPAQLLPPAQRLLQTSRSPWDLAQFELARTGQARAARRLSSLWRSAWHAPHWRPARWGLAVLLLAQVLGLQLWAHQSQRQLQTLRNDIKATLSQSFPHVQLIIDAPLQMERELAQLRQRSGTPQHTDLEPLLAALAPLLPVGQSPSQLDYANQQLRLHGLVLDETQQQDAQARLRPLGLRLSAADADTWLLQAEPTP